MASANRHIFISYRRRDTPEASEVLSEILQTAYGANRVFWDRDALTGSADWRARIDKELTRTGLLVLIVGTAWTAPDPDDPEDVLAAELRGAINRDVPVLPILVRREDWPPVEGLAEPFEVLRTCNAEVVSGNHKLRDELELITEKAIFKLIEPPPATRQRRFTRLAFVAALALLGISAALAFRFLGASSQNCGVATETVLAVAEPSAAAAPPAGGDPLPDAQRRRLANAMVRQLRNSEPDGVIGPDDCATLGSDVTAATLSEVLERTDVDALVFGEVRATSQEAAFTAKVFLGPGIIENVGELEGVHDLGLATFEGDLASLSDEALRLGVEPLTSGLQDLLTGIAAYGARDNETARSSFESAASRQNVVIGQSSAIALLEANISLALARATDGQDAIDLLADAETRYQGVRDRTTSGDGIHERSLVGLGEVDLDRCGLEVATISGLTASSVDERRLHTIETYAATATRNYLQAEGSTDDDEITLKAQLGRGRAAECVLLSAFDREAADDAEVAYREVLETNSVEFGDLVAEAARGLAVIELTVCEGSEPQIAAREHLSEAIAAARPQRAVLFREALAVIEGHLSGDLVPVEAGSFASLINDLIVQRCPVRTGE